ncbi:hypothetical protein C8F04DRAFT_1263681 [Mycena alexandri]|uniref:Uncharacterized protein n=1 Tax=Mycena alexandri TaxID=1745969 RepID=A0AAD6WZR9_9AGAR|nr:hypothetical protein C8F04DRAFT_1263681 [Mycena alexandri]
MNDFQTSAPAASNGAAGAGAQVRAALNRLGGAIDELTARSTAVTAAPISVADALVAVEDVTDSVSHAFEVLKAVISLMPGGANAPAPAAPTAPALMPGGANAPAPAAPTAPAPPLGSAVASLIRSTGPWAAGYLYGVVPLGPLSSVPDNGGKWFAITRGTYVGLTQNSAISLSAVTGVSTALTGKFSNQTDALNHFNGALASHSVAVL